MDASFLDHTSPLPWRAGFLAVLWFAVAALFTANLIFPEITLVAFYAIPPLVAAVVLPPRFVLPLVAGGLTCALVGGFFSGHLTSPDYIFRIVAVTGIGVMTVVLAGARNRQSQELDNERARVRATLDSLLDPHILMRAMRDAGGKITDFLIADANDAACLYNRLPRSGFVGHRLLELLPAHVATGLLDLYRRAIESGRPLVLDDYLYPHDILEEPRYYDIRGVKVGDALSFTWRDVTERHNAAASLEQRVRTDELTKLLNRRGVFEKLEDLRGKSPRTGRDIAVLFVDFDKFKSINDTYGHAAGFATAGAGRTAVEAAAPAIIPLRAGGRVLVFAFAGIDSGTPPLWEADHHPGISMLRPDNIALKNAADRILQTRQPGDIVVVSLHWGENWVDHIPPVHRRIAHYLVESGAADVIHGHSSHHPLPVEVHRGKLVLYGCGDLINDYEGIETGECARSDLVCLYGVTLDDDANVAELEVMPFQLRRFRLCYARGEDREWLRDFVNARNTRFGTRLENGPFGHWRLVA